MVICQEKPVVIHQDKPVLLTTPFHTGRLPELKTIREWCVTCVFEEVIIKGKKYWRAKDTKNIPTDYNCLDCLYSKVADIKVTKPKNWRKS